MRDTKNDIQLKEECFMGMLRVSQISLVKKRHSLAWTAPHSLVMLLKCPTDIRWDRPWLRILAGTQMYHFIPSSWHETEIKEFSLCLKLIMTKWFTCRLTFLVASTGSVFLQHLRAIFIAWYWRREFTVVWPGRMKDCMFLYSCSKLNFWRRIGLITCSFFLWGKEIWLSV